MSSGNPPGPAGVTTAYVFNGATLVLAASPIPGPLGAQAKQGDSSDAATSPNDAVLSFARGKLGRHVGRGECFDLADLALRHAGAKSASDFGVVTPDADYEWGRSVNLSELRPGDIIQFRNYRYDRNIETETREESDFQERPHHTAIVESVGENGAVTVLEQNAPEGSKVHRTPLFFSDSNTDSGDRRVTISVSGQFWFYRPQIR